MSAAVHHVTHPLVQHKLTLMREASCPSGDFRRLLGEIAALLCYEVTRDLPLADRRAQLQRMIHLNAELYPGFRWYLYDGKQTYSISLTIFGPLRVSLFLGKLYIIVNNIDQIRDITDRFEDLIRHAVVHPHEIRDYLQGLLQKSAGSR